MKTAIVAVAYNRVDSLRRLLTSLENASYPQEVTLIVSIDKSDTDAVELFAENYRWKHGDYRVVKHEKNLGLRAHMLSLGNHFDEFDALIVLEDDITVTTSFYHYATSCIEKYHDCPHIAGISLYSYSVNYQTHLPFIPVKTCSDVYLMNCAMSWGQVWMKSQWQEFMRWYDNNCEEFCLEHLPQEINSWPKSSWLKYHTRYCIEEDKYFVFPYFAFSTNNADPGVNFKKTETLFQANMLAGLQDSFNLPDFDNIEIRYDGFFQPKFLGKHLNIDEKELCADLFSNKPACLFRRYLLSNRLFPYKVVSPFALQLRPIEMNIICQREGNELFLYDTTQADTTPNAPDRYLAYSYFYRKGLFKIRTMIGFRRIASLFSQLFLNKLTHLFH